MVCDVAPDDHLRSTGSRTVPKCISHTLPQNQRRATLCPAYIQQVEKASRTSWLEKHRPRPDQFGISSISTKSTVCREFQHFTLEVPHPPTCVVAKSAKDQMLVEHVDSARIGLPRIGEAHNHLQCLTQNLDPSLRQGRKEAHTSVHKFGVQKKVFRRIIERATVFEPNGLTTTIWKREK